MSTVAAPAHRGTWWSSWRLALRMGRRDVARHKGRSALIVLMVAIPVMLLVGGNIVYSTDDIDQVEALPFTLGQTQARLTVEGGPVDPAWSIVGMPNPLVRNGTATPIPGWGDSLTARASALGALVGGTAYPVVSYPAQAIVGRAIREITVLGVDAASHRSISGMNDLVSGRWPMREDEAVVTPAGIALGLPASGTVTLEVPGDSPTGSPAERTVTIVGVATGYAVNYRVQAVELVMLPSGTATGNGMGSDQLGYLVERSTPVTWEEVTRLAAYGIAVTSRAVVLDPPKDVRLSVEFDGMGFGSDGRGGQAVASVMMSFALLLETVLLVGPAFAVGAARQRRTLALAASNGATPAQLRRTVLGQALVLGVLSALVGAVIGVAGALVVIAVTRSRTPSAFIGPVDLPAGPLLIVIASAIAAALVAAWVPSRGLGRLDIVAVLRGQTVSPPARLRTPVVGLVCFGIGAVAVFWSTTVSGGSEVLNAIAPFAAMLGAVLLVVGALLLVPMVLVLLGRAATSAPVALRMAFRDAARQRGRATSTVAAILGVTAVLGAVLIMAASDTAYRSKTYQPRAAFGQGTIMPRFGILDSTQGSATSPAVTRVVAAVRTVDPALVVDPMLVADTSAMFVGKEPPATWTEELVVALRTGCRPEDAADASGGDPRLWHCASLQSRNGGFADRSVIEVGDVAALVARHDLSPAEAAVLTAGGIVVSGEPGRVPAVQQQDGGFGYSGDVVAQTDIVDGKVSFARLKTTFSRDTGPGVATVTERFSLPAVAVPGSKLDAGTSWMGMPRQTGALMATDTATKLSLKTYVTGLGLTDPRGPISAQTEEALRSVIVDDGLGWMYVERGFQPYDVILAVIVLGVMGLLILVATLVSTALSTAENQPLMGTFAAVGATRGTRRNIAAAQAFSLALVGAVLGLLVGSVPGIAIARAATAYPSSFTADPNGPVAPTVVVPWLQLAVPTLVVPLIAAALAWLAIRSAPQVTRRLT